jgi:hypothetical protein
MREALCAERIARRVARAPSEATLRWDPAWRLRAKCMDRLTASRPPPTPPPPRADRRGAAASPSLA